MNPDADNMLIQNLKMKMELIQIDTVELLEWSS